MENKKTKDTYSGQAYSTLNRFGAQPGDCVDFNVFTLPDHVNLTSLHSEKNRCHEYQNLCNQSKSKILLQNISSENVTLCQFILDPASFNLVNRIHMNDPILGPLFKLSCDYCNAVNSERMKIIRRKENLQVTN